MAREFYARGATVVARELLGRVLVAQAPQQPPRAGRIVETEAYVGEHDLACHAAKGRTPRTEVLFGPPGHAYVYLIYGMYSCFNAVAEPEGIAAAVLVRAVEPLAGVPAGVRTDGPGRLCRAFGITVAEHNRVDLCAASSPVRIVAGEPVPRRAVARGPRIGVDYAGPWAAEPLRFWVAGHPCVSR